DQLGRTGLDAVGGGAQQCRALGAVGERIEGRVGSADGRVHGGGVGLDADPRADFAGTGITAQDGFHARLLGSLLTTPSYNPAMTLAIALKARPQWLIAFLSGGARCAVVVSEPSGTKIGS